MCTWAYQRSRLVRMLSRPSTPCATRRSTTRAIPPRTPSSLRPGLPDLDVPIATYTKSNSAKNATDIISSFACGLSGTVVQFTPDRLLQLYPTHDDYVQKYTQAADKALAAGFMGQSDRDIAVHKPKNPPIPKRTR